jgi:hypothetical protein
MSAASSPIDPPERDLVEAMAAAQWRLRRLIVIETQLMDGDQAVALAIITREEAAEPSGASEPNEPTERHWEQDTRW